MDEKKMDAEVSLPSCREALEPLDPPIRVGSDLIRMLAIRSVPIEERLRCQALYWGRRWSQQDLKILRRVRGA